MGGVEYHIGMNKNINIFSIYCHDKGAQMDSTDSSVVVA